MSSDEFLPSYLRHSPINKYKKNAYKSILLPTHWNSVDCWPYISVMDEDNLKLKYNGPGRFETYSYDDLINYELVGEMYPMCGMAINGECIVTNFGTKPFMFDIDNYAEAIFAKAEPKERT
ncbi:17329_t:CDS:2 [Gigaspora rosea]|nr:17329_t:CDS:2 [Gigaspora rosea]